MEKKHLGLVDDQEPIIALCTPRGSGAIALIRLSGVGAVEVADAFCRLPLQKKLISCASHTIHFGRIFAPETTTIIDEVLLLLMRAPKTFTGQDTVEISCHNNPFIIDKIIALACASGARLARAGEFSKRAFLQGKIDLVQAEAINDIIHAQTEESLRRSMEQLQGSLSYHLKDIEARLIKLLAIAEASFEFLEEEQQDMHIEIAFKQECSALYSLLQKLLTAFAQQQQVRQGIRIALVGRVNAGKSTLFNRLVKQNRAIVADVEGTTRDSIEVSLYKGGMYWTFVDTAGLRSTDDVIEQLGIERTLIEAKAADVILCVFDTTIPMSRHDQEVYLHLMQEYASKIIAVFNKQDIQQQQDPHEAVSTLISQAVHAQTQAHIPFIHLSAQENVGIAALENMIDEKIQALFSQLRSPYLLTQRQAHLISEVSAKLEIIEKEFSNILHYELLAYHLKESLEMVAEITGKNASERVLDKVFDDFCVGK